MGNFLVIVESPSKAKTITRYLGKKYKVKSSVGHIRDLPTGKKSKPVRQTEEEKKKLRSLSPAKKAEYKEKKQRATLVNRMGVDPDNDWAAQYEILPGKEKVVKDLKEQAKKADIIYLATDMDREGEAIAWHLKSIIGGDDSRYKRLIFNEITKKAINSSIAKPTELNLDYVDAQQARRFLDRVVGFELSPLLWKKIARGLSAGRVQSVAVRLIVEREREIRAFVPEEYWELEADLLKQKSEEICKFQVTHQGSKAFAPKNEEQIKEALQLLDKATYTVEKNESKPTSTQPLPPFITSTLQQAASTRLNFSVKKTMMLAQRLYEAGYITYMRTDSVNISEDARQDCIEFIQDNFGKKYLPEKSRVYSNKSGAQEAHEAIRPTSLEIRGKQIDLTDNDAKRLYDLIWCRFVACQMSKAEYLSTSITVKASEFTLKVKGRILKFDGHTKVMPPAGSNKSSEVLLPSFEVGEILNKKSLNPSQHFTKPTPRFSEAGLVKELEKQGIGRPSTYANIISTIQERGYVTIKKHKFYAEKIGELVTTRLIAQFEDLLDYTFTANLEKRLDAIASGKVSWKQVLNEFYQEFSSHLQKAALPSGEGGMKENSPMDVNEISCPKCSRNMQLRSGSTGLFLGCHGYQLPVKERCTQTLNLLDDEESEATLDPQQQDVDSLRKMRYCKECKQGLTPYLVNEENKLHICSNYPECQHYEIEKGQFHIKGYEGKTIICDKCDHDMELKSGRFGKYFDCTNDDCKNTRKLLKNGEPAPPKADPIPMPDLKCAKVNDTYVLRDGASGLFLAASQFPKHRETRAPLLSEILPYKDKMEERFHYLFEAPLTDDKGNPSVIRFSRKSKSQYITSQDGKGKNTAWRMLYKDGKWVKA